MSIYHIYSTTTTSEIASLHLDCDCLLPYTHHHYHPHPSLPHADCRYDETLCDLEREVIKDLHLPISHLYQRLSPLQGLFTTLTKAIDRMERQELRGSAILHLLHEGTKTGSLQGMIQALEK